MRLLHKRFEFGGDLQEFEFYPVGDVHLGARACDEDAFFKTISEIKKKDNAYVILMGDQIDAITRTDPRFESGGLADWIPLHRVSEIANVQLEYAIAAFEPIKDKIIGAMEGNHETKLTKHYGVNVHRMFCNALGIENLDYSCGLWLDFRRKTEKRHLTIYAHHGHGGGRKAGAKINRMHDHLQLFDSRMYLMGHVHERGWAPVKPRPKLSLHNGTLKMDNQDHHFGLTGTYLKTWDTEHSGYGEVAGYPPVAIGGISFTYEPTNDRIREHLIDQKTRKLNSR